MRLRLLLAVGVAFFLFGCIGDITDQAGQSFAFKAIFGTDVNSLIKQVNVTSVLNYSTCSMFVCQNKTGPGFLGTSFFADTSLLGGNCSFVEFDPYNNSAREKIDAVVEDSDKWLRTLDLGQGPSFADFNDAMPYCANSYRYVVEFVEGNSSGYIDPPAERYRASCALDASILPVYAFYNKDRDSEGRSLPPDPTQYDVGQALAGRLAGVGPAILITETNPKKTQEAYDRVKQQAILLKATCSECLVFLSITLDEVYTNTSLVLQAYGLKPNSEPKDFYLSRLLKDPQLLSAIDGIAFGIDSRFSQECGGDRVFSYEVIPLISYINELNKSSLIYYTYLEDTPSCDYAPQDYAYVYESFFISAPSLARKGLIGFVPQPFYSTNVPFEKCDECAMVEKQGPTLKEVNPAFSTWFYGCENYYKESVHPYSIAERGLATCDLEIIEPTYESPITRDEALLSKYTFSQPSEERFIKCSACLFSSEPGSIISGFESFTTQRGSCEDTSIAYSAVDSLGGDGVVARALSMRRAEGDRCYVEYGQVGFNVDDVATAYAEAGCGTLEKKYGRDCSSSSPSAGQECKVLRMGLFGFDYGPGEAYSQPPTLVGACGGKNFNPFLARDAACIFVKKMDSALLKAQQDAKQATTTLEEEAELTAILTSAYMIADVGPVISLYRDIRASRGNCGAMGLEARQLCCSERRGRTPREEAPQPTQPTIPQPNIPIEGGGFFDVDVDFGVPTQGSQSPQPSSQPGGAQQSLSFTDPSNVCSYAVSGDFAGFTRRLVTLPRYALYRSAFEVASSYAYFYNKCEDCYSSQWKQNICDAADDYGVFIRGCP